MQWIAVWVSFMFALLAGCATAPGPELPEADALFFPPPPGEPRYVYERTVRASADIQQADRRDRMRTLLTGEAEQGRALAKPFDVSVCQGQVYISDTVMRAVLVFDVPGRRFFEFGGNAPGALRKPLGLDTDAECNVYVADGSSRLVQVYDQAGRFLRALGGPEWFERLSHVAVDAEGGRLYAVDTGGVGSSAHRVRVFDVQTGAHLYDIGTRGSEPGRFNLPRDIEVGPDGNLYIVDGGNFRVQVLTPQGEYLRSIGSLGRRSGQFARPKGIALDTAGNIYVSDAAHGNFQIFDNHGLLLLFVGERSEQPVRAGYMLPAGIDVDEDGRVYMVDQYFRKLDIFRPAAVPEHGGFLGAWPVP